MTRKSAGQEVDETYVMHYDEYYPSICFRSRRFVERQAWAADPPTRFRRFVTSVRAWEGRCRGIFDVTSSLLLVRTSDDDYRPDLITAERFDRICFDTNGVPKLLERKDRKSTRLNSSQ